MQAQSTADPGVVVDLFPLDARGRKRTPGNTGGAMKGRRSPARGRKYPPNPLTATQVVQLLEACAPVAGCRETERLARVRLRAMIAVLWRSGLRATELVGLDESDLNRKDLSITIRHGKGDKHGMSGMDQWGWDELDVWLRERQALPYGAVFCVLSGPTAGRAIYTSQLRYDLKQAAARAGLRHRANPHSLRHGMAVDLRREGVDLFTISRQLRHVSLDVTAAYLEGIDPIHALEPVTTRPAPVVPIASPN